MRGGHNNLISSEISLSKREGEGELWEWQRLIRLSRLPVTSNDRYQWHHSHPCWKVFTFFPLPKFKVQEWKKKWKRPTSLSPPAIRTNSTTRIPLCWKVFTYHVFFLYQNLKFKSESKSENGWRGCHAQQSVPLKPPRYHSHPIWKWVCLHGTTTNDTAKSWSARVSIKVKIVIYINFVVDIFSSTLRT